MMQMRSRIIKLGGSLLDIDDLPGVFQQWLRQQTPACNLVVVGGGALAEQIRALDGRHQLGDEIAHELAVEAMRLNTLVMSHLLPGEIVGDPTTIPGGERGQTLLIDPAAFLAATGELRPAATPPKNWDITSDSISAQVAQAYGASELVLLKSALPLNCTTWEEAAEGGYVDRFFPCAVQNVSHVRCVNLRDPQMPQWQPAAS